MCACVNVYSPFDQGVSLPDAMGVEQWREEGVHTIDLGIKATSVYLKKKKSQLHSRDELCAVMMLTQV